MTRVAVTGGSGLLGSYVVDALSEASEVVSFDTRPPRPGFCFIEGSILDVDALRAAFEGVDSVVHLAAAANIAAGSCEQIIELNTVGSCNVLEAALQAGVRRVLLCSSDSVMGNTVWPAQYWCPERLPVDEAHPMRPADPYGLSKLLAEEAGRSYSRRGLEVLALRPVFILFPSMLGEVRARHADPKGYRGPAAGGHAPAGGGLCWHHVDPRDVAEAFRLAIAVPWQGFESFFLAARSTLHPTATIDLIRQRFGRLPHIIDHKLYAANPHAPMFDCRRARNRLGWQPHYDHRSTVLETSEESSA